MISCYKAATSTVLTTGELFPHSLSHSLLFIFLFSVIHFTSHTAHYVGGKDSSITFRSSRTSCFPSKLSYQQSYSERCAPVLALLFPQAPCNLVLCSLLSPVLLFVLLRFCTDCGITLLSSKSVFKELHSSKIFTLC